MAKALSAFTCHCLHISLHIECSSDTWIQLKIRKPQLETSNMFMFVTTTSAQARSTSMYNKVKKFLAD